MSLSWRTSSSVRSARVTNVDAASVPLSRRRSNSSSSSKTTTTDTNGDVRDEDWQACVYASLQLPLDVLLPPAYTHMPPSSVDTTYDVAIEYGSAPTMTTATASAGADDGGRGTASLRPERRGVNSSTAAAATTAAVAPGYVRVRYGPYYHVHHGEAACIAAAAAATTTAAAAAVSSRSSHGGTVTSVLPSTSPTAVVDAHSGSGGGAYGDGGGGGAVVTTATTATAASERRGSSGGAVASVVRNGDEDDDDGLHTTTNTAVAAAAGVRTRDNSAEQQQQQQQAHPQQHAHVSVNEHDDSIDVSAALQQPSVVLDIKKGLMAALTASPHADASQYNSDSASERLSNDANDDNNTPRHHRRGTAAVTAQQQRNNNNNSSGSRRGDNSNDDDAALTTAARARVRGIVCNASHIAAAALLVRLVRLVATGDGRHNNSNSMTTSTQRALVDCVTTVDMSYTRLGVVGVGGPPLRYDEHGDAVLPTTTATSAAATDRGGSSNSNTSSSRRDATTTTTTTAAAVVDARDVVRFFPDEALPRHRTSPRVRARVARRSLALCYVAPLLFVPGFPRYRVKTFVCTHCALRDEDAYALALILRGKTSATHACALATLDASYNDITDVGAEYLKKALKFCPTLTTLQLTGNTRMTNRHGVLDVIARRLQRNAAGKSNARWYHHRH